MQVTNVSFTLNSYKVLPIPEEFREFFDVKYSPPGRISAGLSNTIEITLNPKVNKDIITYLPLLAETGPIKIPIECYCKKALFEINPKEVNFGNIIFFEKVSITLTLTNEGALSSNFSLCDENL